MRKNTLCEDYFANIQTEEQAYWLGMLTADGWIRKDLKGWAISLKSADESHVELLRACIGSNAPITKRLYRKSHTSKIEIYSKRMVSHLMKLGITPKKSLVVLPWHGKKKLLKHYWRGVFDGDGCICKNKARKKGGHCYVLSLCGSKWIVDGFRDFVQEKTGYCKKPYKKGNIYYVEYGGTLQPQNVAKTIYTNCSVFLTRKKKMIDELLATKQLKFDRSSWTLEYLNNLHDKYGMWKLVAKKLDVSSNNLDGIKKRLMSKLCK